MEWDNIYILEGKKKGSIEGRIEGRRERET